MFNSYLKNEFATSHEREFWTVFEESLRNEYTNRNDFLILIGNIQIENGPFLSEIDALILKRDAIIIVDFKNYGGELIFDEKNEWRINGDILVHAGAHQNPLFQIKSYKHNLTEYLIKKSGEFLNNDNHPNFNHISGLVVFSQTITITNKESIPGNIKTWFKIADDKTFIKKIRNFTSREINISLDEYKTLLNILNLIHPEDDIILPVHITPIHIEHVTKKNQTARILDYYISCLEQEELKQLELKVHQLKNNFRDLPQNANDLFEQNNNDLNVVLSQSILDFISNENANNANPRSLFYGYSTILKTRNGKEYISPVFYCQLKLNDATQIYQRSQAGECLFNKSILKQFGLDREEIENISNEIDSVTSFQNKLQIIKDLITTQNQNFVLNNATILFFSDTSGTIYNLLKELNSLSNDFVIDKLISNTPAENLIKKSKVNRNNVNSSVPFLEIFRLNNSQEESVQSSVSNDLTVITGPPGTGKSQVVLNLIANAIYEGKSILFASKNNKAVDVVRERLIEEVLKRENLQNLIIRIGNNDYMRDAIEKLHALSNQINDGVFIYDEHRYEQINADVSNINNELIQLQKIISEALLLIKKTERLQDWNEMICNTFFDRNYYEIDYDELSFSVNALRDLIEKKNLGVISKIILKLLPFYYRNKYFNILKSFKSKLPDDILNFYINNFNFENHFTLGDIYERLKYLKIIKCAEIEVKKVINFILKNVELPNNLHFDINQSQNHLKDFVDTQEEKKYEKHTEKINKSRILFLESIKKKLLHINTSKFINEYLDKIEKFKNHMIPDGGFAVFMIGWEAIVRDLINHLPIWTVANLSIRNGIPLLKGGFDLLVIDESSQCDIASAIPLFYRAKKICIIGDDMQLKHISGIDENEDTAIATLCGEPDIGGRYTTNSLFDICQEISKTSNNKVYFLDEHFRSDEKIMKFSNECFYIPRKGRGMIHQTTQSKLVFPLKGIYWINIVGGDEVKNKYSINEVNECINLYNHLIQKQTDLNTSFGITTPFRNQADRIARKLIQVNINENNNINVLGNTIHKFQGDEKDVMILSLVVSNNATDSMVNFINFSAIQLLNVAISRARSAVFVIGDKNYCKNRGGLLKKLTDHSIDYSY